MSKHCVFVEFLLMEGYVQDPLQKEQHIAPLVERFTINYFGKVLLINFVRTWNNLISHCISAKFWLNEGYVQGAARKELHIAPLVERCKTTTLRKSD